MDSTVRARPSAGRGPGRWLREADAVLARRAALNAARAVAEEQARRRRRDREERDATRLLVPRQRVG